MNIFVRNGRNQHSGRFFYEGYSNDYLTIKIIYEHFHIYEGYFVEKKTLIWLTYQKI